MKRNNESLEKFSRSVNADECKLSFKTEANQDFVLLSHSNAFKKSVKEKQEKVSYKKSNSRILEITQGFVDVF